jgi:SAM dependent carboxyl methyltransferase
MPEPMASGGVYDHHSDYQLRGAVSEIELVGALAAELDPDARRGGLVIADYGCSQGRVSNVVIARAVARIRARHRDVPLSVVHNDLLTNDWATFVERLRADGSYLRTAGGPITPLISATSFYEPVTPRGIVDLGLSFAAAQWLAAPGPATAGTALYFDQLDPPERAAMAAAAHADWTRFLGLRADELAPGGVLVVNLMGVPDGGTAAGHDVWGRVRAIAAELAGAGVIDRARLDAYVIPIYERTAGELRRPFDEQLGRRLELRELHLAPVPNPATLGYRRDGDAARLARDFTGFFRAFSEPSLAAGLGADRAALDELYRRLGAQIERDADGFEFEVHALTAVIASR